MSLPTWSVDDLFRRCQEETQKYYSRQESNNDYCFELLRRALYLQDNDAFTYIFQTYQSLVRNWVYRTRYFVYVDEDVEFFVSGAFATLYKQLRGPRFLDFSNVQVVLDYLKACAFSLVQDYWRKQRQISITEPIDDHEEDPYPVDDSSLDEVIQSNELWAYVQSLLPDESMRRLAYYCYQLDLKPADIEEIDPTWNDRRAISVARQQLKRILSRDKRLAEWLGLVNTDDEGPNDSISIDDAENLI